MPEPVFGVAPTPRADHETIVPKLGMDMPVRASISCRNGRVLKINRLSLPSSLCQKLMPRAESVRPISWIQISLPVVASSAISAFVPAGHVHHVVDHNRVEAGVAVGIVQATSSWFTLDLLT